MSVATIHEGDVLTVLAGMPDASMDAVVCDPPYGLSQHSQAEVAACLTAWVKGEPYAPKVSGGFMGAAWDAWVPGPEVWREVLRVLRPGGHALVFAGTRSMDLMAIALRLAGFELRDAIGHAHDGGGAPLIGWCYGSGFPKSLDTGKAIDKVNAEGDRLLRFTAWMRSTGLSARAINEATGTNMASHYLTDKTQPAIPTAALWAKLRPLCGEVPAWVDQLVERVEAEREVMGHRELQDATKVRPHFMGESHSPDYDGSKRLVPITAPATPEAQRWHGYGTSLKPAWEPVLLARKPLDGTVAQTVLAHGTGALNIDGCRIDAGGVQRRIDNYPSTGQQGCISRGVQGGHAGRERETRVTTQGRWPANVVHDGSEAVVELFPETGPARANPRNNGDFKSPSKGREYAHVTHGHDDAGGSAARFFYCAKPSPRERGEGNVHPTVKPIALATYLAKLVLPPARPDGTPRRMLVPFAGSGSEVIGALAAGWDEVVGIEREPAYAAIARRRIAERLPAAPVPVAVAAPVRTQAKAPKPARVVPGQLTFEGLA